MKQISKDPFEAAFEEQEDSPPESPTSAADADAFRAALDEDYDEGLPPLAPEDPSSSSTPLPPLPSSTITTTTTTTVATVTPALKKKTTTTTTTTTKTARPTLKPNKDKDDDEDEDEDNVDVELGKYSSATGDPVQKAQMQAMLTRFSPQQMSRYESFRRAGFQKSNMKRLLASISGSAKVSVPMTIVVSGIAKMFVGELVETSRMVMTERRESGPIRPCHLREAYRRLKLEGKVPKRSVSRLFR